MPTLRELIIELSVMLAIGLALAALGPFGSFEMGGFALRLAYWVPMALIGYVIVRPIVGAAEWVANRQAIDRLPTTLIAVAIASAPATLAVLWWNNQSLAAVPRFEDWFQLYVQVALVGVLVTGLFMLIEQKGDDRPSVAPSTIEADLDPSNPPPTAPRAAFLDRLPPAWADCLLALEMEDHYVRAHGPDASTLILLRMRDAEAELASIDGLRVHRSWWVARTAVERALRDGRGYRLRLTNGLDAPVARDRVAVLRDAGWL